MVRSMEVLPRPWEASTLTLRPTRVERVLGVAFDDAELKALLTPLGFTVQNGDGKAEGCGDLSVIVPGYRSYDVTREIDLIEEITRAHGYDRFPRGARRGATHHRPGPPPLRARRPSQNRTFR